MRTSAPTSTSPTYPTHTIPKPNTRLQLRFTGSFRLAAGKGDLHPYFNFAGSIAETVLNSLRHSCGSELTRQGTSLP